MISVEKISKTPERVRAATNTKGMRVWEVIKWLKGLPQDAKVCTYTEQGSFSPVVRVMMDGRKAVIF